MQKDISLKCRCDSIIFQINSHQDLVSIKLNSHAEIPYVINGINIARYLVNKVSGDDAYRRYKKIIVSLYLVILVRAAGNCSFSVSLFGRTRWSHSWMIFPYPCHVCRAQAIRTRPHSAWLVLGWEGSPPRVCRRGSSLEIYF